MTSTDSPARFDRLCQYLLQDPGNLPMLLDAGELGPRVGHAARSRELLEQGLLRYPDHEALLFHLGTACLALQDYTAAIRHLSGLIDLGSSIPAVRFNLAFAYSRSGQLEPAKTTLSALSSNELAELPQASLLLAALLHLLEDWDGGIAVLEQHLRVHPNDAEAWGQLSLLLYDNLQSPKAKEAAERALAFRQDQSNALITLGSLALELRNAPDALDFFGLVLKSDSQNGRAWSGLAFAQMLRLDTAAAAVSFAKAVEFMPNHIGTWHGLAWLQILAGDLVGARESFNRSLALDRNFSDTHGGLAVVSALEGKERDSELAIRRSTGLNRKSFPARYAKSVLLERRGQTDEAKAVMRDLLESSPIEEGPSVEALVAELILDANVRNRRMH